MGEHVFKLTFDAVLRSNQMKSAVNGLQTTLNTLHLPQNVDKGFSSTFDKLTKKIEDFQATASQPITKQSDFNKLETQAKSILELYEKLKIQGKDLVKLKDLDVEKLFPSDVKDNIAKANKAIEQYKQNTTQAKKAVQDQTVEVKKLEQSISNLQNKKQYTNTEWKKLTNDIKTTEEELEKYKKLKEEAENTMAQKQASLPDTYSKSSIWRDAKKEAEEYTVEINKLQAKLTELNQQKVTGIKEESYLKQLNETNEKLEQAKIKLEQLKQVESTLGSSTDGGGLRALIELISQLTGIDISKIEPSLEGVGKALVTYFTQNAEQADNTVKNFVGDIETAGGPIRQFGEEMRGASRSMNEFNTASKELDMLKSRIQYFFGLNNAIQLVRRTMRAAYETIKELDKVMTETAVVTDFSVGDMWAQLPDYTRRANELGVTTKAAYEAATIYYQQGLKTNEVMAMSNETLKMARIAGLDAAVATDRMTNAIRSFNMAITEDSAQRVNDVYSRLAATSASNVDEISTAMTKVASLAHNANMEFETTAAFLAQIIETTRESAETAGTALKTVVARFSEVKKLIDEGQLKGTDEEGEAIDVNKVSSALRVAGIDLNRYFLGEVGLDDIFMELASKWDSLTAVQQRYIATQAAGSRQQSRFIALMSDYARTQELVGEAYNSNGAAAKQFAKTQESLESKLARLKNAWDQFAMGILNSDLVKGLVDFLTFLLNGINNLTSGFGILNEGIGGVISSLLKLSLLVGGLNLGKGLFAGLFGTLGGKAFTSQAITAMLGEGATATGLSAIGKGFIAPLAPVGKLLAGIGAKAAAAVSAIGGIGVALGGVAVAAAAVTAGYIHWEKYTPKGQLHYAEKIAKKNEEIAKQARAEANAYKDVQQQYKQYNDAVRNASTLDETNVAIKNRNDYILSLIEQDAAYAEYLNEATLEDGQIMLTLDEEAFQRAIEGKEKSATSAEKSEYESKAVAANKKAEIQQGLIDDLQESINWNKATHELAQISGELADERIVEILTNYGISTENDFIIESTRAKVNMAQTNPNFDIDEVIQGDWIQLVQAQKLLAEAQESQFENLRLYYIKSFEENGYINDSTKETIDSLSRLFAQIDDGKEDSTRIDPEIFEELITLSATEYGSKLLNVISGNISDINFTGINEEDFLAELGIDTTNEVFQRFNELLGFGEKGLEGFINNIVIATKQQQKANQARLYEKFSSYGYLPNNEAKSFMENSTLEVQSIVENILDQLIESELANESGIKDFLSNTVFQFNSDGTVAATADELREIQSFINSINLDNPIQAYVRLKNGINGTNEAIQGLAENIFKNNSEILNSSNLVKTTLEDSYDTIQKQLEKILKKRGHVSTSDLEELVNSSEELQALLDEDIISARTLAKTLTLIGQGKLSFDDLNDSVLSVLDNIYTLDDMVTDLHDFIKDFDEGTDYGEGVDFFSEKAENLQELIDNFEFGNERTKKLWNAFFGEDYQTAWEQGEDYVRRRVEQMRAWLENDAYGFFSDANVMEKLGITQVGDHQLHWDLKDYESLEDLLDRLSKDFGITKDAARAFVEAFASHGDADFSTALKNLSIEDTLNKITTKFVQGLIPKEDLELYANMFGMELDDFIKLINAKFAELGQDIKVETLEGPLAGKNLFSFFEQQLEADGTNLKNWIYQFIENGKLSFAALNNALEQMGYTTASARADLINSMSQEVPELLGSTEVKVNNLSLQIAGILGVEPDDQAVQDIIDKLPDAFKNALTGDNTPSITLTAIKAAMEKDATLDEEDVAKIIEWLGKQFPGQTVVLNGLTASVGFGSLSPLSKIRTLWQLTKLFEQDEWDHAVILKNLYASPEFAHLSTEDQGTIINTIGDLIAAEGLGDKTIPISELLASPNFTGLAPGSQIAMWLALNSLLNSNNGIAKAALFVKALAHLNFSDVENPEDIITQLQDKIDAYYNSEGTDKELKFKELVAFIEKYDLAPNGIQPADFVNGLIEDYTPKETVTVPVKVEAQVEQWTELPIYMGEGTGGTFLGGSRPIYQNVKIQGNATSLEEAVDNALADGGTTGTASISAELGDMNVEAFEQLIRNALEKAGIEGASTNENLLKHNFDGTVYTFYINWQSLNNPVQEVAYATTRGGKTNIRTARAAGGEITSNEVALTGEIKPELVWNEKKGYAYLVGTNGPEFANLKSGDKIFNGDDTEKILQNSGTHLRFNSYANVGSNVTSGTGTWVNKSESGSGGGGSGSSPTVWENDLDWLYNLVEDIKELERQQEILSEKHDQYLEDISKTGRDLYDISKKQLNNLYTQLDNEREMLVRRRQELEEQLNISGYLRYIWWNDRDQTIEIDWDAIEAIQDKDTYDEVKDLVSRIEQIQDQMDEAYDAILDIQNEINEIEKRYLEEFTDFQDRVMDAIVNSYEQQIDNLEKLNDTLNDTNSAILDSIQKEIDYERQIRDNTETERNISDMEARLAYLRRDTTGGNVQAIRDLEKELEEARTNYQDTIIDQAINHLQEQNDKASEQRQQQIDLLNAQLDYWKETGALWTEVGELMETGINGNGALIRGSKLEEILANAEGWKAMSEEQKAVWADELITATNQAGAYLIKISEGLDSISAGVWAILPNSSITSQKVQYATGGLNTRTGWAWLDGTASEPEYVLNARQTDAFIKLSEVLPDVFTSSGTVNNNNGNVYVELNMNVGEISSDYDVDRMVDRIKSDIYQAGSYRNANVISRMR